MPDEGGVPIQPADRVADPSPLTTAALLREVGHVRIELASAIANVDTRLDAMDQAVKLFKDDLVRVPTDTDKQVGNLKEKVDLQVECLKDTIAQTFKIFEEKFVGIISRFNLNDLALNAALAAAKEAVGKAGESSNLAAAKAEAASTKQMDQVRDIVNTSIAGLNDKIDVGGNRMTTLESQVSNLLQTVAQLRAVAPVIPPPPPQTTPVGLWVMGGLSLVVLLIILAFEIAQRAPAGLVR